MDYWALGHIHRHRIVSAARPTAVYCGNPQGRDPGETDPRGCYIVTVDDAGEIRPEFHPADVVRWQLLEVAVDGLTDEESLVERVAASVDEARSAAERSIVARVRLTGRGPLHRSLLRAGMVGDVLNLARERLGEAAPFAWVESVHDETRMELDLDERRLAEDFFGDVLRRFANARLALEVTGGTHGGLANEVVAERTIAISEELEGVLDGLFANERARRYLRDKRPSRADLVRMLAAAETLVADRLGGEG